MKKLFSLLLALMLASSMLGALAEAPVEIYFLNFKPEIATVYEEIAKAY